MCLCNERSKRIDNDEIIQMRSEEYGELKESKETHHGETNDEEGAVGGSF